MIDLRLLREDPDRVRASQRARGEDVALVDALLSADERRRSSGVRFDELRAEQKSLGKLIGRATGDEKAELLKRAEQLKADVKAAEAERDAADAETQELLLKLSNLVHPDVPVGGEEDFVTLETHGTIRDFSAEGFEPKDHLELGQLLGAIDVERGAKVSGSRFYFLTGVGALLELALVNAAMAQATAAGFTPMLTPALVRPQSMAGTGFLGQAAQDVYHLDKDDLYLVGTSEVALAAYHMDEILDADKLPLRYAGFSPCFRREAGSHGKDTRGIFRVHQFDKVEMFSYVKPEESQEEHRRLLEWEKQWLTSLELPFRVIDVASGDLGSSAARKYDCEAWIPTQGKYRELTSTSDCTEFQSRRLQIRMREDKKVRPLATLNGTLCAVPRTIVAILENHQQPDGSVRVPEVLRPYLGGREILEPVAK
ncbi:serine--tRNA ligase [Streptomyces cellulosae]|uniref:Serine--tRNA ligase n=2 Tax=Streptomyces TaxID=1883 RepID=A0ABU3J4J5_9ACTN|nr:serine--tRNA ligase [Streptomyces sp. McG7]MBT2903403.1 serine--tRNA ligase [Streptomyces sp. McG8]MCX4477979.1 serine--tRNA ligase [Streptomyces cellulosae]MDQ0486403.1 seryl-tRNA synthetase [Streptomyces thermodiastaticus]MDT6969976.1 serine--tRNA ligase [Streptomyces thermocarboxydus]MDX3412970.1 serine--tRNA ligase [Streptomyces sp. MD20-1-1]MXQ56428.1 serine--tRNA ligase [Streptomyces sp. XHT-2]MYQ30322.1 serine--tRNA ligase [Streptomyces sp. SID4956]MYW53625.1 serine--tRNA ligase [